MASPDRNAQSAGAVEALDITVKGVVQGVGFRPFVYRLAREEDIAGWVINDVEGVRIHAEGPAEALDRFVVRLSSEEPPAAQVSEIDLNQVEPQAFAGFAIQESDDDGSRETTQVSPDLGICDACLAELFDPSDRRFHYPFINCTNCGPRFTVIDRLPYDRPNTSMAGFTMCEPCQSEYDDPADRRFHAQPNACFTCGPRLGWAGSADARLDAVTWADGRAESDALIDRCVELLREGGVAAVKGLGGYHLVCDAHNEQAIVALRQCKRRPVKPLAVMAESVEHARAFCHVGEEEAAYLSSPARPIVLLAKRTDVELPASLAPGVPELGVMLPATPVQALLARAFGGLLVMTSGNLHDEPICMTEQEAFGRLAGITDAFLVNDRPIVARYDDSVLRLVKLAEGSMVQFLRRARGYAPAALELPVAADAAGAAGGHVQGDSSNGGADAAAEAARGDGAATAPCVVALGSQQKNTFTLTRGSQAFVSQHLGNMDDVEQLDAQRAALDRYQRLFRIEPTRACIDAHPDYVLAKQVRAAADQPDSPVFPDGVVEVQHHFAHLLSVMGEAGLEPPVCGFVFDGTGYGLDGAIWGGEVLLANHRTFERLANLAYFPLPGGAAAVKDPRRAAFGVLWACDLLEHPVAQRFVQTLDPALVEALTMQVEQGVNAPMTSSMGRLFDAVSALLGVCCQATYDGQPAIELENALWEHLAHEKIAADAPATSADPAADAPATDAPSSPESPASRSCEFGVLKNVASHDSTAQDTSVLLLDPEPVLAALLDDVAAGVPVGAIARRFHDAVAEAVALVARFAQAGFGIERFALTGGVFQNRYLLRRCIEMLSAEGCAVALNIELPPNDGNISYGQAVLGCQVNP